jgi:uncharacterized protein YbgA (DUF1722 family)
MDSVTLSKKTTIWQELCDSLTDRYEILSAVNFLSYDNNMEQLRKDLSFLRGNSFSENQRLIFSLYDTQYYLSNTTIGFTIENLRRLLIDLDISPGYCILFTNHHGIQKSITNLYKNFPIIVSENNFCFFLTTPTPKILQQRNSSISHHFCFMSNIRRDHRSYIRLWLEDKNLINTTVMSWHSEGSSFLKNQSHVTDSLNNAVVDGPCCFIYTCPFTRCNDKVNTTDDMLLKLWQHSPALDVNYRNKLIEFDANQRNFEAPWLANTFMNIVTETVFTYPHPYLTEKTFKNFWHCSPFVIVGADNSLSYLRSVGFKTFGNWIDESYDSIKDPEQRLIAILDTLDTISKWSLEECQTVYNEMQSVLTHNLMHYQDYFCNDLLTQTKKELQLV